MDEHRMTRESFNKYIIEHKNKGLTVTKMTEDSFIVSFLEWYKEGKRTKSRRVTTVIYIIPEKEM